MNKVTPTNPMLGVHTLVEYRLYMWPLIVLGASTNLTKGRDGGFGLTDGGVIDVSASILRGMLGTWRLSRG